MPIMEGLAFSALPPSSIKRWGESGNGGMPLLSIISPIFMSWFPRSVLC